MTDPTLVDRLAALRTIGAVPRAELEWLASHGTLRHAKPGDVVSYKGRQVEGLFIVLSGRVAIFVDRGAGLHKILEWNTGDITGLLPYSRMIGPPGNTVVQETTELLMIHRDDVREMIRECHEVTSILVHLMIDRARAFTSSDLHDEKMLSLGKLSAGLAHELNNPASAIKRSAELVETRLNEAEQSARALGSFHLTDAQFQAVDAVRAAFLAARDHGVRSPLEQAEREDRIAGWLAAHGLDDAGADALAETAITLEALDSIAGAVDGSELDAVLRWSAADSSLRGLTAEIREAAKRISDLVAAIKGFTHMDQATVAEPVDVVQGLENTVAVLKSKARGKSAAVVVEVEPGLPPVRGFGGELNQIWVNLIDNALDAIPEGGRIEIRAARDHEDVVVRIADNGPGIPAEIRERIFDPFFTTKPVGQGTGLGLDIVQRLVRHNDGQVTVESRPGRTEFRVALPVAERDAAGRP